MDTRAIVRENWLTRKTERKTFGVLVAFAVFLLSISIAVFAKVFQADQWLPASGEEVFQHHHYWRLWTSLFVHGDMEHLLSNALLFFPLAYLLLAHFGFFLFPFLGIFLGGFINGIVLSTLPSQMALVGISGVVYWMGGAWLTLVTIIDRRQKLRRRFAVALFLSFVLFVPESYKPQVSYLSHFLGFFLGVASAFVYYFLNRRKIEEAEVIDYVVEEDEWITSAELGDGSGSPL